MDLYFEGCLKINTKIVFTEMILQYPFVCTGVEMYPTTPQYMGVRKVRFKFPEVSRVYPLQPDEQVGQIRKYRVDI